MESWSNRPLRKWQQRPEREPRIAAIPELKARLKMAKVHWLKNPDVISDANVLFVPIKALSF
jgi:hypothetical protein